MDALNEWRYSRIRIMKPAELTDFRNRLKQDYERLRELSHVLRMQSRELKEYGKRLRQYHKLTELS